MTRWMLKLDYLLKRGQYLSRLHICKCTELCREDPACSTCTFPDSLLCIHIWKAVGNSWLRASWLSRGLAMLHQTFAIPTQQGSLAVADTGWPGPTHNQPGTQHAWCVGGELPWSVEWPHMPFVFWQIYQV